LVIVTSCGLGTKKICLGTAADKLVAGARCRPVNICAWEVVWQSVNILASLEVPKRFNNTTFAAVKSQIPVMVLSATLSLRAHPQSGL
jgi:hypothetical protein